MTLSLLHRIFIMVFYSFSSFFTDSFLTADPYGQEEGPISCLTSVLTSDLTSVLGAFPPIKNCWKALWNGLADGLDGGNGLGLGGDGGL